MSLQSFGGGRIAVPVRRFALAIGATAVALVVCEIALVVSGVPASHPRLYPGDREPVRDNTFDPHVGWKLPPNAVLHETSEDYSVSYRSNAQGFRGERPLEVDTSGRRIVFVGDSFTFGSGVGLDDTFVARLERMIGGSRCHNLGIGGFGIDQMWMALRHYGLPLQPDLVVLSFIREDLDRCLTSYRLGHAWLAKPTFRLVDGRLEPLTEADRPGPVRRWLSQSCRLCGLLRRAERSVGRRFAVGGRWRLNRALFEAIRDDCRKAGAALLVVHIPVNRLHPAPVLERVFGRLDIDFLDLASLLPPDAQSLYFPNDRHLNAAGHRFVAESIYRHLEGGDPQ